MAKPLVQAASRELYANLLSTAHDGRGRNARYRQNQLYFLHNFLRANSDKVRSAIKKDTTSTETELDIELGLSLAVIRNFYEKINFEQSIVDEYRVANNQDNPQARIPYGIVLLRPTVHTRFYSIISATATALAAGNVILLELETSVRSVDAFFRNEFRTYDGEAFAIATSRVENANFLGECLVIDQTKLEGSVPHVLKHHPDRIAIAVVDRTSDLAKAAKAILRSKHSFQGTSPYAVDIIMINEWVKTRFLTQCDEFLREEPWSVKKATREKIPEKTAPSNEEEEVLLEFNGITLSEIKRSSESLRKKSAPNKLRLITVSGLVDATTIASDLSTPAALYCFSSSQAAKYLGQYIDSQLRFVNQIPQSILVGPTVPEHCFVTDFRIRYDTNMMSRPAPEVIRDVDKSLANVYRQEVVPLKAFKQHSGWDIGFFDRGVLIGAMTVAIPTLCLLSYGGYRGLLYAYSRLF